MFKTISRSLTRSRNQKGFTLVELMVVVVILGILAALVVPTLSGQIDRARNNRTIADMKTIHNTLQLHFADNNQYPAAVGTVVPVMPDQGLAAIPTDAWGRAYYYAVTTVGGRNTGFSLFSSGPDGVWGSTAGGDDLAASNTIMPRARLNSGI